MGDEVSEVAMGMFDAYGEHCGWKTFDGRDMPRWDGINDAVRSHWMAAAKYAIDKYKAVGT
jgi:hypothetical protein